MRFLVLAALVACSSEPAPAPAAAPPAPAPTAAPAPAPAAPTGDAATAFACCADPKLGDTVDLYLAAQRALAADDDAAAKTSLSQLGATATSTAAALQGDAAAKLGQIASAATAAGEAGDLKARRAAFKAVSGPMIELAKSQVGGEKKIAVAYCPMADASWLQQGDVIANPYYGSEMPTCGSFK